jgi:fucose permease
MGQNTTAIKQTLLLAIIYLAFISLGLPDSLLGSAWPAMFENLMVPMDYAGILSMIVAAGTVISSLYSGQVIQRLGVAKTTAFSVLMTALALLGYSFSDQFAYLCLLAIPLGLGAGSVDSALNHYVALHYEARHMNWLHSFWGVGAAIGPMIMAAYLAKGANWTRGYEAIGWIQLGLVFALAGSLPLWIKGKSENSFSGKEKTTGMATLLQTTPGLKQALLVFFLYCSIEATFGLWGASFLVFERGIDVDKAARLTSLYFLGITLGRFLSGFLTAHFTNRQLFFWGQGVIAIGLMLLFSAIFPMIIAGFLLIGLGCAPIFPSLLHETPTHFGAEKSQTIMGMQMASAYVGITLMPFLFGKLATFTGNGALPAFLMICLCIMFLMTRLLIQKVARVPL